MNVANWMWLSASQFFHQYYRVYSPIAFGKKHDPSGKLIRKFCPELADFPDKARRDARPAELTRSVHLRAVEGARGGSECAQRRV